MVEPLEQLFVLAPAFLQIGLRVQVKLRPVPQDQLAAGNAERVDDHDL